MDEQIAYYERLRRELDLTEEQYQSLETTLKSNKTFSKDKLVSDIYDNQRLLVATVEELRKTEREFILDGHFCLLNAEGAITRVSLNTYISLQPNRIIILLEKLEVIVERRFRRDGIIT